MPRLPAIDELEDESNEQQQLDLFALELVPDGGQARVCEVAPNQWVAEIPAHAVRRFAICELIAQGDGSYRPEICEDWTDFVRLTRDIGARLGIPGLSYTTLYRLILGGWIEATQPAPNTILFSVGSLMAHLRRTMRSPDSDMASWWSRERKAVWSAAL